MHGHRKNQTSEEGTRAPFFQVPILIFMCLLPSFNRDKASKLMGRVIDNLFSHQVLPVHVVVT